MRRDLFQTICAQATVGHVSLEPGTGAMAMLVVRAMLFNGNLQRQYFAVAIDCQNFNGNLQRQFFAVVIDCLSTATCNGNFNFAVAIGCPNFNGNLHKAALTTMRMHGAPAERYVQ